MGDPKNPLKIKGYEDDSDSRMLAVQPWGFEF